MIEKFCVNTEEVNNHWDALANEEGNTIIIIVHFITTHTLYKSRGFMFKESKASVAGL